MSTPKKKSPAKKKRGIPKQKSFLAAFRQTASVTRAAQCVGIDRALHYRWLQEELGYSKAFQKATEDAAEIQEQRATANAQALEDVALERAINGWLEPVIYHGELCFQRGPKGGLTKKPLTARKFDNTLTLAMLRAHMPEKYRERLSAELTGRNGGPIETKRFEGTFEELLGLYRQTIAEKAC